MNKTFIILVFLAITLNAQTVKFGLKGGLNRASLTTSETQFKNFKTKNSYHIGGMVEIMLGDLTSIQTEVLYSSQGAINKSKGFKENIKLKYINIPLLLKIYTYEGISADGGPYVGFLNSARIKNNKKQNINFKQDLYTIDYGLAGGLTGNFDPLQFGIRYYLGLKNLTKQKTTSLGTQNAVIQVSVGFFF